MFFNCAPQFLLYPSFSWSTSFACHSLPSFFPVFFYVIYRLIRREVPCERAEHLSKSHQSLHLIPRTESKNPKTNRAHIRARKSRPLRRQCTVKRETVCHCVALLIGSDPCRARAAHYLGARSARPAALSAAWTGSLSGLSALNCSLGLPASVPRFSMDLGPC